MPELPDVTTFQRYLDATALDKTIDAVEVRDDRLLCDVTSDELGERLVERAFDGTRRHGTHLFALLDGEPDGALALHFGMTGTLRTCRRAEKEPEHARVILRFENGCRLAIVSLRLLGEVSLTHDVDAFVQREDSGPDALDDLTDVAAFRDEMYAAMRRALEEAIRRGAEPAELPDAWLTPHRGQDARCACCGGPIERAEVSGRGAYLCRACRRRLGEDEEGHGG